MLDHVFWEQPQLAAGIHRLAQQLGGVPLAGNIVANTPEQLAYQQGIEAVPTQSTYGELRQTLSQLVPGVLAVSHQNRQGYLLVSKWRGQYVYLLAPDGGDCRCTISSLIEILRIDRDLLPDAHLEILLAELNLSGKRLARARELLMQQQFEQQPITQLWGLRPHSCHGLKVAAHHAHLGLFAAGFMTAHLLQRLVLIASLGLLGYAITQGVWTVSVITTWLLLMLSHWGLGALGSVCQMQLNIRTGMMIKRQLLYSALHLPSEALAKKGPAQILGQAMEAAGLHTNALAGVFSAINAVLDISIALVIALLMKHWAIAMLLIIFVAISSYPIMQFIRAYGAWARERVRLSHLTIEHMQGNRTRLLQSGPDRWHKEEERRLHNYWLASVRVDQFSLWLQTIIPSLWLILGCGLLCAAIFFATTPLLSLASLLGVVLLAWQAWNGIAESSQQLALTWHSYQQVLALLNQSVPAQQVAAAQQSHQENTALATLEASQLNFGYSPVRPIIRNLNLHLRQGKQYLLQGESGSGKSTLLGALAGQIKSQHGWLLLNDRDLSTWGSHYWRKKICWVPQFHDNYIFSGSLLYNLLLGRNWPPTQQDIADALAVCDALGLLPVIRKMPAGILQPIGEMGWQLSHGEASRVYLARALIQKPDFLLLDECLGALDASTSLKILDYLQRQRAATLLCMHP